MSEKSADNARIPGHPNLKPFPKGVSGNPGGKPKGVKASVVHFLRNMATDKAPEELIQALGLDPNTTNVEAFSRVLWTLALKGKDWAAQELIARLDGKVKDVHQFLGSDKYADASVKELAEGAEQLRTLIAKAQKNVGKPNRNSGATRTKQSPS